MSEYDIGKTSVFLSGVANVVNETYSYINKSTFYLTANSTYINYYTSKIIPLSRWLDGYVPQFHNLQNGIFSTRLASTLVNLLTDLICDNKIYFISTKSDTLKDDNVKLDLLNIEKWNKTSDFQQAIKNSIRNSLGLGTCIFKLNQDLNGDLWCECLPLDSVWFRTNLRGNKLTEVNCLIKHYSNNLNNEGSKQEENFYLVERRYYKKELIKKGTHDLKVISEIKEFAYSSFEVYKMNTNGSILNAPNIQHGNSSKMTWSSLPSWLKKSLKLDYGIVDINKPKLLPFKNLGAWLFRHYNDNALSGIPFGQSILENIIAYLPAWDMCWSYKMRDMYQGKGIILVPQGFMKMNKDNDNRMSAFNGLDESMIYKYNSTDPDKQKPEKIQFDLRVEEWEQAENDILKKISCALGISTGTLASFLGTGTNINNTTATAVESSYQNTISFITRERNAYSSTINDILHTVCLYLNTNYDIECSFATPIQISVDRIVDRNIKLISNGLTTPADAIKEIYPNENTNQYQDRLNRLETYKNAQLEKEILSQKSLYESYENNSENDNTQQDNISVSNGVLSSNNAVDNTSKENQAYNDFNKKEMINAGDISGASLGNERHLKS